MVKNLPPGQETRVRSLGQEGRLGNPLQYGCLENPMDGGACWAAVCGDTESGHHRATNTFTVSSFIIYVSMFQSYACATEM